MNHLELSNQDVLTLYSVLANVLDSHRDWITDWMGKYPDHGMPEFLSLPLETLESVDKQLRALRKQLAPK